MPDNSFVSRKEYNIERDKIWGDVNKNRERIISLEAMCDALVDLPKTMQSLDKNMALMQQNLTRLNQGFDELVKKNECRESEQEKRDKKQSEAINRIDEKSKVDLLEWIKKHWFEFVSLLALLALILKGFAV